MAEGRRVSFEPAKFFIGLVDFFAILMPGALLAYLGKDWAAMRLQGQACFPLEGVEAGTVFLFASYLLGHFIFLIGALLDDWVYDPLRKLTYWGQIERLADGKPLSSHWLRALAESRLFKNADRAVIRVQRMKARSLEPLSAGSAINAFQWSKARLSKDHPEGLLAVERFEANSKFFRSFVVVLSVLTLIYALYYRLVLAGICGLGVLFGLWRYVDQRFKATQQAYWFIITLGAKTSAPPSSSQRAGRPTHAGGVVVRRSGKAVEFLLVEASQNRNEWVLPKGHIEPGEDPRQTAVREVKEETGHWARVVQWSDGVTRRKICATQRSDDVAKWIDDVRFGNGAFTRFYLMELAEPGKRWPVEDRRHDWFPLAVALQKATFTETRELLTKAHERLTAPTPR